MSHQLYTFDILQCWHFLLKQLGTTPRKLISLWKAVLLNLRRWQPLTAMTTSFDKLVQKLKSLWPGEGKLHAKIKCQVFLWENCPLRTVAGKALGLTDGCASSVHFEFADGAQIVRRVEVFKQMLWSLLQLRLKTYNISMSGHVKSSRSISLLYLLNVNEANLYAV